MTALTSVSPSVAGVALPQDRNGIANLETALGISAEALEGPEDVTSLDRLRRYVFLPETPEPTASDDSLVFFSSTDEGRESVEIARYIQSASKAGTRFDQIAVLVRNPDMYQPLIEDAFHRSGIPGHYTRGSVRPNPTGRAFLALLACRSEGLSASRFSEYLSLGQVPSLTKRANRQSLRRSSRPCRVSCFQMLNYRWRGPRRRLGPKMIPGPMNRRWSLEICGPPFDGNDCWSTPP